MLLHGSILRIEGDISRLQGWGERASIEVEYMAVRYINSMLTRTKLRELQRKWKELGLTTPQSSGGTGHVLAIWMRLRFSFGGSILSLRNISSLFLRLTAKA